MIDQQPHVIVQDIVEGSWCNLLTEGTEVCLLIKYGSVALQHHWLGGPHLHRARLLF